jgi:hypothetical protein
MLTEDQYLFELRKSVDQLVARTNLPKYKYPETEQTKVMAHFLDRAIQIGEAAFRIRNLPVPLDVLIRVFCEDLIRLFWSSLSDSNAAQCAEVPVLELTRMTRLMLGKDYAKVLDRKTGQDVSAQMLPELAQHARKRKSIEQIATECGLQRIYDIPFRFASLPVHGNTFDLHHSSGEGALTALPAVVAFLGAVTFIADSYPDRTPSANKILEILGLR